MDRKYAAQIAYPLINGTPLGADVKAILDVLLYVSIDDALQSAPGFTDIGPIGAWLTSRAQATLPSTTGTIKFLVKIPNDPDYVVTTLDVEESSFVYIERIFTFDTSVKSIQTVRGDDGRSALTLDVSKLTAISPGAETPYTDATVEPGRIVPCRRRVGSISLYNEYRVQDPTDRSSLPPDNQEVSYGPGSVFELNDGYNCAVVYDKFTKRLRITGGVGLGRGTPPFNPWDDVVTSVVRGIRSINGVNQSGIVPIEHGTSVAISGSEGSLEIRIRDQGDDD